jgi:Tfp pilus assembly pilus retraction ATPase PilT
MLMQTGGKSGMHTMNQSLAELVYKKSISMKDAMDYSMDVEELKKLIEARTLPAMRRVL